MATANKSRKELHAEIEELRYRLEEAQETLAAIRNGDVDALVLSGPDGERIFTLEGAEMPYRVLVESMNEGAASLAADGTILYCNSRLAAMLRTPLERLIGASLATYVAPEHRPLFAARLGRCSEECEREEIALVPVNGEPVPVLFSCCIMEHPECGIGVVITDIRAQKEAETLLREAGLKARMAKEREKASESLREANVQLEASLKEKEVLLKEIHHRVKNNLQVISSLISLQADGSKEPTVREILEDVIHRVRSMALIHEKLYQSSDLASINFADYAQGLLNYIWRSHGATSAPVRLTLDLEPVSFPVDVSVPLGLILNELADNTLKHAFDGRSEGNVTVSLKKSNDGHVSLSVSDDGVGLPEGLDWRQAQSLGLSLVQMLSEQIDASVNVDSRGGTRFEIVIP